jgi:hypothetical protein
MERPRYSTQHAFPFASSRYKTARRAMSGVWVKNERGVRDVLLKDKGVDAGYHDVILPIHDEDRLLDLLEPTNYRRFTQAVCGFIECAAMGLGPPARDLIREGWGRFIHLPIKSERGLSRGFAQPRATQSGHSPRRLAYLSPEALRAL